MDLSIIQQIFDLFIEFSVTFAITLAFMEYIFQFILRIAFGRSKDKNIV